jgi:hypothetical protein
MSLRFAIAPLREIGAAPFSPAVKGSGERAHRGYVTGVLVLAA